MTDRTKFLHDLFTCALEGGVSYWAGVHQYHWGFEQENGVWRSDLSGYKATLVDEEGAIHHVDRVVMARGWNRFLQSDLPMAAEARRYQSKLDEYDYDAEVADAVVQLGVFGEVIYG